MNAIWQKLTAAAGRYRKAIAGLWGYVTPPVVVWIAHLAGWDIDADTALLVIGIGSAVLGTGAVAISKPNDLPAAPVSPAPKE